MTCQTVLLLVCILLLPIIGLSLGQCSSGCGMLSTVPNSERLIEHGTIPTITKNEMPSEHSLLSTVSKNKRLYQHGYCSTIEKSGLLLENGLYSTSTKLDIVCNLNTTIECLNLTYQGLFTTTTMNRAQYEELTFTPKYRDQTINNMASLSDQFPSWTTLLPVVPNMVVLHHKVIIMDLIPVRSQYRSFSYQLPVSDKYCPK